MDKHIVALVPLSCYEQEQVNAAVSQGISLLGGMAALIRPEERILLKPNLLARAQPDKAVTTHPAVFEAVARLLWEEGYRHLSYGDSPGNPTTTPEKAASACGVAQAAQRWHVTPADFDAGILRLFPDGQTARSFYLCKGVLEQDALINICKMKTHALERITGAVKNLYGCIYGLNKGAGHTTYPSAESFADMLCDLHRCLKPRLHILDGVMAMEGNGPSSGTPTPMNVLLFSTDAVALDSVFAALVHVNPSDVPTCVSGAARGLGVMDWEQIEVRTPLGAFTVQQAQQRWGNPHFQIARSTLLKGMLVRLRPLQPLLQHRPKVDRNKCIACGVCEQACPVPGKAVHSGHGQKATYDYQKCIRCYCCQEMCPAKAIRVYRNPLGRLLCET